MGSELRKNLQCRDMLMMVFCGLCGKVGELVDRKFLREDVCRSKIFRAITEGEGKRRDAGYVCVFPNAHCLGFHNLLKSQLVPCWRERGRDPGLDLDLRLNRHLRSGPQVITWWLAETRYCTYVPT